MVLIHNLIYCLDFFTGSGYAFRSLKLVFVPLILALLITIAPEAVSVLYYDGKVINNSRQTIVQSESCKLQLFSTNHTPCESEFIPHDLPFLGDNYVFVGREEDILKIINMINIVHIVGIHGAPGFGKSMLAIHVGYEMINRSVNVRYVDVADKFSHLVYYTKFIPESNKLQSSSGDVQIYGKHPLATSDVRESGEKGGTVINELLIWSKTIHCHSVLILDNCNDLLSISRTKQSFITLIKAMVHNSRGNLSVIITSRQKLFILDDFDSITVSELNMNASLKLLFKLAPNMSREDAELIFQSTEGCPLALKVVGRVLHSHGDRFTQLLRDDLQNHLLRLLDQASSQEERFGVIMDSVFHRLPSLKRCGYYVSLLPGSFDYEAANNIIIPFSTQCMRNLLEQSLLEEYNFANQTRYKMHKLIREYMKEKGNSSITNFDVSQFEVSFCEHFTGYMLSYASKVRKNIVNEFDEYVYTSEGHNIRYLLQILLSSLSGIKQIILSDSELKALAFAMDQNLIETNTIIESQLFYLLIKNVNDVCDVLNSERCGDLFSRIIQQLYKECMQLSNYRRIF